jgi:hypothetical protein
MFFPPVFKGKKINCWPTTIKIVVGQQSFAFAISIGKCRNGFSQDK